MYISLISLKIATPVGSGSPKENSSSQAKAIRQFILRLFIMKQKRFECDSQINRNIDGVETSHSVIQAIYRRGQFLAKFGR